MGNYARFDTNPDLCTLFWGYFRISGLVRPADGEIDMNVFSGILAASLLVYLFLALLWPERFS
jgi:K+-transporting ATPase KdpF subunit